MQALLGLLRFDSADSTATALDFAAFQVAARLTFALVATIRDTWAQANPQAVTGLHATRVAAEEWLHDRPLGAFLLRLSLTHPGTLVVSHVVRIHSAAQLVSRCCMCTACVQLAQFSFVCKIHFCAHPQVMR